MSQHHRLAARAGLAAVVASAAVCASAGARSAPLPSLCTRLVRRMHRAPEAVLNEATPGADWMRPWIAFPAVHLPQGTEAYGRIAAAWRAQMPKGLFRPPLRNIEALQGTGLFVANTILGSGDCLSSTFFAWKPGGRPRVTGDPQFPLSLCSRDGSWAKFAIVLGQPAYLATGQLNHHSLDEVMFIAPWQAGKWARPCPVSIRFRYAYAAKLRYCGSNRALCRAARKVAPVLERRYHAYSIEQLDAFNVGYSIRKFSWHAARTVQARALVDRARRIAEAMAERRHAPAWVPSAIPAFFSFFPLRLEHRVYLGAATGEGRSWAARWILPHGRWSSGGDRSQSERNTEFFLFSAPRAHGDRLVPLAVFSMHGRVQGVRSIEARDGRSR